MSRTWAIEFYLSYLVLRDDFNFTPEQLEEYAEKLSAALKDCNDGRFSTSDIAEVIKQETGIDISKMM